MIVEARNSNYNSFKEFEFEIVAKYALVSQIQELSKAIIVQNTISMIHEYGLDDLHTSFFNKDNEKYDDVKLGDFRSVLDCYGETFDRLSTIKRFNTMVSYERNQGRSNKPSERTTDIAIVYKDEEDPCVLETLDKIESSMISVLKDTDISFMSTRYDYINSRYVAFVKKENSEDNICSPLPIEFIFDTDNENVFVYNNDEFKVVVNKENKEKIVNAVNNVILSSIASSKKTLSAIESKRYRMQEGEFIEEG